MTKISGNIVQLKTLVSDFDKNVRAYNSAVNSYFDEIKSFNGWEGDIVASYLSSVNSEKSQYVTFGKQLSSFVDSFSDIIDDLQECLLKSKK